MTGSTPTSSAGDPRERPLRRSWWLFAGSFFVLGLVVALRLTVARAPLDIALAGLVVVVGYAAILHRNATHQLEVGRREEAESFARILQGLSRSVSPDAIVHAIVEELGAGTGADHIVVVRRHPDANGLAATLVSTRPSVPDAATLFPRSDLEDPLLDGASDRDLVAVPIDADRPASELVATAAAAFVDVGASAVGGDGLRARAAATREHVRTGIGRGAVTFPDEPAPAARSATPIDAPAGAAQRIADRIADRTRSVYGLRNTLAVPLRTDEGVIGAIVLSRRSIDPWSASARRLLGGAAMEASAALARATRHHAAETRATTDALTGLPNRRYFDEFCGLLARRRRTDDAVGVLIVDIDFFKSVNDAFGHAAGDQVLRAVASAIASAVREGDVPARFGGEEFAVLLRNPSREIAIEVAERIRAAVGRLDLHRHGPRRVTVSVGVAVASAPDQPIPDLVELADKALYEAKRAGRDRVIAAA